MASLNLEIVGKGAKTEKRAENVSVDVVEDDEDRRVCTEVTNRLRSKCVVNAKFISNVINLEPIALRLGAVCSRQ